MSARSTSAADIRPGARLRSTLRHMTVMTSEAGDALAAHVGHRHAPMVLVDPDKIEIIAADLLGGNIGKSRAVEPGDIRRDRCGQQHALDLARDVDLVVEPLLLAQLLVDLRILERIGRLVGNRPISPRRTSAAVKRSRSFGIRGGQDAVSCSSR